MQEMHEQKMHFLHEFHRQQLHAKDDEISAKEQEIKAKDHEMNAKEHQISARAAEVERRVADAKRMAGMFDGKVAVDVKKGREDGGRERGMAEKEAEVWKVMGSAREAGAGYGLGEKEG